MYYYIFILCTNVDIHYNSMQHIKLCFFFNKYLRSSVKNKAYGVQRIVWPFANFFDAKNSDFAHSTQRTNVFRCNRIAGIFILYSFLSSPLPHTWFRCSVHKCFTYTLINEHYTYYISLLKYYRKIQSLINLCETNRIL